MAVALVLHLAVVLPLAATGVWSWHRYSGPLLLEVLDADEVLAAAVLRLTTAAYALLALGLAALAAPDRHPADVAGTVVSGVAAVAFWLGVGHGLAVTALVRARPGRRQRAVDPGPTVWAPPPAVPWGSPSAWDPPPSMPPTWTSPPPRGWASPPPAPPPYGLAPRHVAPPIVADPWAAHRQCASGVDWR